MQHPKTPTERTKMPTFVDSMPKSTRGRSKKYNFDEIYDTLLKNPGRAVVLKQGEDFKCKAPSIRQFLYRDTKEKGLKANIVTDESVDNKHVVTFSVVKAPPEPDANGQGEVKDATKGTGEPRKAAA